MKYGLIGLLLSLLAVMSVSAQSFDEHFFVVQDTVGWKQVEDSICGCPKGYARVTYYDTAKCAPIIRYVSDPSDVNETLQGVAHWGNYFVAFDARREQWLPLEVFARVPVHQPIVVRKVVKELDVWWFDWVETVAGRFKQLHHDRIRPKQTPGWKPPDPWNGNESVGDSTMAIVCGSGLRIWKANRNCDTTWIGTDTMKASNDTVYFKPGKMTIKLVGRVNADTVGRW